MSLGSWQFPKKSNYKYIHNQQSPFGYKHLKNKDSDPIFAQRVRSQQIQILDKHGSFSLAPTHRVL